MQCTWPFMRLFGEVALSLFVAGALLGDSLAILASHFSWQTLYLVRCE